MRVLAACEFSGAVRSAFARRGHDAWSCDLLPTEEDGSRHLQCDVRNVLADGWDLMVAFPPCRYLTRSNAWRWAAIAEQRAEALTFVRRLLDAPIPRVALENPAGAITRAIRPPDQYVQPWWFGDLYQKGTGLWLRGLPPLQAEVLVRPASVVPWTQAGSYGRREMHSGVHRSARERGRTLPGLARAMAEQWG